MHTFPLDGPDDFEGWRKAAKSALHDGLPANKIYFQVTGDMGNLFGEQHPGYVTKYEPPERPPIKVPQSFVQLARQTVCHSDPERFDLLYRLLQRVAIDKDFLKRTSHQLVYRTNVLAKEVRRDVHKMKAFVRFRKTGECEGVEQFVAWFEPSHHIVRYNADFFVRRFANMQWSILTPDCCAHWDTRELTFTDGVPKSEAPKGDVLEDYWKSYYASIFNPARLKIDAMTSEMPKKYWKNLPEAELIPDLIESAKDRERAMREAAPTLPKEAMMAHIARTAEEQFPSRSQIETMGDLTQALKGCRACPLWKPATQAVSGRGPADAQIMLVGEQPGDQEDLRGEPFVGPAGQVLREIMQDIGQPLERTYVTNAVKHFKFEPRGKRRLHKNPTTGEIEHCKWWLNREIELVKPKIIVALGGSAVRALIGRTQSIKSLRGKVYMLESGARMVATNHPSYILRLPDGDASRKARETLREDLQSAFALVA